jgi:hypothetical protein
VSGTIVLTALQADDALVCIVCDDESTAAR